MTLEAQFPSYGLIWETAKRHITCLGSSILQLFLLMNATNIDFMSTYLRKRDFLQDKGNHTKNLESANKGKQLQTWHDYTHTKSAATSTQIANTAGNPNTTNGLQGFCPASMVQPKLQLGDSSTLSYRPSLLMLGYSSPWQCRVWVNVKVLYSDKSLVVEFMIKAASVSLHSSTHARTKMVHT